MCLLNRPDPSHWDCPHGNLSLAGGQSPWLQCIVRGSVVQALVFKERQCCRIMGKGLFDKMSIPEALFSGIAFWMGDCYLWMWVRSHLHFSPSQTYPPVLKTVWDWHIQKTVLATNQFPVLGLPGMQGRIFQTDVCTLELHRFFCSDTWAQVHGQMCRWTHVAWN